MVVITRPSPANVSVMNANRRGNLSMVLRAYCTTGERSAGSITVIFASKGFVQ